MLKRTVSGVIAIHVLASFLAAQTVKLDGVFSRFITYYITSIDITTGSSDVQLFDYLLECVDCDKAEGRYTNPVWVSVTFEITIRSPALGIPEDETVALLKTAEPFEMNAPIRLDNRDFTIETLELFDVNGDPVPMEIEMVEHLDMEQFEDMFSVIVQTGRLPDGVYRFSLAIDVVGGTGDLVEEVIKVATATTLQLTSPGGPFEAIDEHEIYTLYPVFQWESEMFSPEAVDNCPECGFFIRVAEFRCEDHATVEEAIEEVTVLPLDQATGWYLVGDADGDGLWQRSEVSGNQLSFMYPTTGAVDLRAGGIYVWQIQKRISTTEGIESINSPIYAFQIKDLTVNPIMQALEEILPEDILETYRKPCGPLTGFTPTGNLKLDGLDGDLSAFNALVEEFRQGTRTVTRVEVR